MGRIRTISALLLAFLFGTLVFAGSARADESNALEDIVAVLQQKGLIDAATGDEILAKQEKSDAAQAAAKPPVSAAPALTEGYVWSGDFRLRNEQFWYGRAFGGTDNDENRFRYRARVGFTKQVNPWALVGIRIAAGTGDYRSPNVNFGQQSNWAPNSVYLDRAYGQFALPDPGGIGLTTTVTAGRMANPFMWKNSLDKIIWDEDINPSGIALTSSISPMEGTKLFATIGYFVELSQSSQTDAKVWGYQLGGQTAVAEKVSVGARATYYDWGNVTADPNFVTCASASSSCSRRYGNLPTAFDNDVHIGESTGFVTWSGIEEWPALAWGTVAYNFSAERGTVNGARVGPDAAAYGYGIEFGDPKAWFLLGVEYTYIPANAILSLYTDSDMFDGFTNREGVGVYVSRELAPNTEFKLTFWEGEPIRTTASGGGGGPYNPDDFTSWVTDSHRANRKRMYADLNFKF
jgi:hypothetical protein